MRKRGAAQGRAREPRALLIAASLWRRWGDGSMFQARREYSRALTSGDIARADLYHAVWSALRHRDKLCLSVAGRAASWGRMPAAAGSAATVDAANEIAQLG